ncbi:MAG: thioredoxin fold domain-containing protein [Planctomycetes bacterium]|nr:thioredoxin fold domain-containing protein [Planctomycetota bacterium]
MALPEIDDTSFDAQVAKSDVPVLLDFGATWCGPCKALKPILEALAPSYAGKAKFLYVDADKAKQTAVKFGITSLPTVVLVKGGAEKGRIIGLRGKGDYQKQLDAVIAAK